MPTPEPVSLEDLFLESSRRIRRRWMRALAPWEVAPQQARALRLVGELQPVRPGVLAEQLRIAPRSVTDVVDALEKRGHLVREPDPADRRAVVLSLTREGAAVERAIAKARREATADHFARLSATDRAALTRILRRLATDDPAGAADLK